jgi:hypothetical protein
MIGDRDPRHVHDDGFFAIQQLGGAGIHVGAFVT